ncbi:MAG: hypothetical protein KDK66_09545, partial [Deltaproteobacteria bacterium]|nr:hypothetical protein [Deltaproteobacteria bacterium]
MIEKPESQDPNFFPRTTTELFITWILAMMAFKLLGYLSFLPYSGEWLPLLQSGLLIFFPLVLFTLQGRNFKIFELKLKELQYSLKIFLLLSLAIFPLLHLLNHFFQSLAFGHHYQGASLASLPEFFFYHLLAVALPEEVFFRGYFQ